MSITRLRLPLKKAAVFFGNRMSPAMFAASSVLLITVIALFTQPFIGMADNGDFFRILYSNGLFFHTPDYDSQYLGYFVKQFGIFQYYNENQAMLFSSHSLVIRLAIIVNKLIFSSSIFDIRVLGLLFTVFYTVSIYLLVEAMTWGVSKIKGFIIAGLAIFVLGDTAYTAYFNSFYGEAVVYITTILLFASWLLLYRKRYNDYVLLAIYVISGLLLTTTKQQNAPVGIIIAVLGISVLFIRRTRPFRVIASFSLVGLLLAGVATYVLIPKEFVHINQYHAMARGILLGSENPEETLKSFGINEQYAVLKDTIVYEQYPTIGSDSPLLEEDFYGKYGFGQILQYYITHPDNLSSILNAAAKNAFTIRPPAMGNYEQSAGKDFQEQTRFFSAYSMIKQAVMPKTFGFIVLWMALIIGLYMPTFVRSIRQRDWRQAQKLVLVGAAMALGLSGIVVSVIGAGDADLSKHEFLFTLTFDLVSLLAISDGISRGYAFQVRDESAWKPKPSRDGAAVSW